ncbi:MAG: hypothetical protein FWE05_05175 [Defluviitaleaceae bacterium]|nr:hypothetical protein [Defluviitaleaceae bacterium]
MNPIELKTNTIGIAIVFASFTIGGILLSLLYIVLVRPIDNVVVHLVSALIFAVTWAVGLHFLRKFARIASNPIVFAITLVSLIIIYYLTWHRLIGVPSFSAEESFAAIIDSGIIGEDIYESVLISIFWFLEMLVIFTAPLITAFMFDGVYLYGYNQWAVPRHLPYSFSRFTSEERARIANGDIHVILNKPFATSADFSTVSLCFADGKATEYIAIYKSSLANNGKTKHTSPSKAIQLTRDKLKYLVTKLEEEYYGN